MTGQYMKHLLLIGVLAASTSLQAHSSSSNMDHDCMTTNTNHAQVVYVDGITTKHSAQEDTKTLSAQATENQVSIEPKARGSIYQLVDFIFHNQSLTLATYKF
jgi:hypothetical protein